MTSRSWGRSGRSWANALSDAKACRTEPHPIREERLRSKAAIGAALSLSAWRGRSGRRYVVTVHPIARAPDDEPPGAVILGVRRDAHGTAILLGAGHRGTVTEAVALAGADGATEIHLHRLADTDAEREAIVEDLVDA